MTSRFTKIHSPPTVTSYRRRFGVEQMPRTEQNTRTVTAKQLKDACKQRRHGGRFLLDNSQLFTVKVCGQIISIDQNESHTNYIIYDGTGTINGRIWPHNDIGETELTGAMINTYYIIIANVVTDNDFILLQTLKTSKVTDYNHITVHMLTTIHEHCDLEKLRPKDVTRWEQAIHDAQKDIRSALNIQLDKEAIESLLATSTIRESLCGATTEYILAQCHLDDYTGRATLQMMLNEGSIYNTMDYNHFKLAHNY